MSGNHRIFTVHEEYALSVVQTALPNIDRDGCIDILQNTGWNPDAAVDMMGGRENIPKKFGSEKDWPKLSDTQSGKNTQAPMGRRRTSSGDGNVVKTKISQYSLKHSSSIPLSPNTNSETRSRSRSSPSVTSKYEHHGVVSVSTVSSSVSSGSNPDDLERETPDIFEPIDGENWQELNLDAAFLKSLSQLYPDGLTDDMKGGVKIRIPPSLSFELYRLILLNETYRQSVVSTDDVEGEPEMERPTSAPPSNGAKNYTFETGMLQSISTIKVSDDQPSSSGCKAAATSTKSVMKFEFSTHQLSKYAQNSTSSSLPEDLGAVGGDGTGEEEDDGDPAKTCHHYRELAYYHHKMRNEYKDKLFGVSRQVGSGAIAEHYRSEMQKHQRLMNDANQKAKELILQEADMTKTDTILDLHMLFLQEAMKELQKFLQVWKQKVRTCDGGKVMLKIITGKGNNSYRNVARIRPAVINCLTSQHIAHVVVDGMVIVTLHAEKGKKV